MTDTLPILATAWLGSLFVYSGGLKFITTRKQNVRAVETYQLLPGPLARVVGLLLPPLELAVGATLLLTPVVRPAAFGAAILGVVFVIASGSAIVRRLDTSCGCAGELSERVGLTTVLRASLITMVGGASAVFGVALPLPIGAGILLIALAPAARVAISRRRAHRHRHVHHGRLAHMVIAS